MSFDLNKRHQQILWATIRQYISTAEPVGSKTLVDGYNLNISPATIRSGFATLEKAGFLYQPHTSAGRIPSDSGYRLYVDRLIQPSPDIGRQLQELLTNKLDWDGWSIETILRGAVEVLATLSGYITMITLPQTRRSTVKHIQLICVESSKIMLIVVWDAYETQSILMQLPPERDLAIDRDSFDRELQVLSNFLNSKLQGRSVLELFTLDWSELDLRFQQYVDPIDRLLTDLSRQSKPIHSSQMMIWGISEVLGQPEFSQLQQVKTLLHLLESEQDKVSSSIFDPTRDPAGNSRSQVAIRIGTENPLKPMQACTLISANYHQDSIPVGSVGLLGPTRMLYEDSIALVKSAAEYITAAISQE
ncbi:heat-inducible transcriptional repressor HrcA [Chamaesiphon sp. OTE_75_metabat_556]|jgi:heat-inducible transcriptional repressor|uniref:heat-inducible transcriptional repressor HrcA n=1 Tax=Chamaesiphon sp. OTE_75_metabat_556 TaxID=2964692 RepID=UPI00286BDB1A|nr:heat-inducible transcriptional repressor HrcA [Chamaesiphon sp. OTE_75_metabat_556]